MNTEFVYAIYGSEADIVVTMAKSGNQVTGRVSRHQPQHVGDDAVLLLNTQSFGTVMIQSYLIESVRPKLR